jgi:tetratricopeptide (TPR) repeat protein
MFMASVEIFCCYARKDHSLLNELRMHLIPLKRQGLITLWADTDIDAGIEWEKEIERHLETAQIILLLISPEFIASDYCYGIEMKRAMERHNRGEARVIPIILRPVYWQGTPFSVLQVLPLNGKPIIERSSRHGREKAFLEVTIGIKEACDEIEKRRSNYSPSVDEIWDGKDTTPYRQTVQLDTTMSLVMIHKAVTLFELKRYEEALMHYSVALSYDDQCARTYFPACDLGEAYYNLKQYFSALKAYKEALDLDPEDIVAHVGFGNTLFKLRRYQEAMVALLDYSSYKQGFSQMMRRVHLDCKSSFTESRYLEFFLREARMQRVEWMVKESKRPSGRRGEA